jgi:predicted nucleic acid-binding protein
MIWLLDTNIVIDVLSRREGYEDSLRVLRLCEAGAARGFVSTATVMDVMYILRKHLPADALRDAVRTLLTIVEVAEIQKTDILRAMESEMRDFEDAAAAFCARRIGADHIITRNVKDFSGSPVPAMLPAEAAEKFTG